MHPVYRLHSIDFPMGLKPTPNNTHVSISAEYARRLGHQPESTTGAQPEGAAPACAGSQNWVIHDFCFVSLDGLFKSAGIENAINERQFLVRARITSFVQAAGFKIRAGATGAPADIANRPFVAAFDVFNGQVAALTEDWRISIDSGQSVGHGISSTKFWLVKHVTRENITVRCDADFCITNSAFSISMLFSAGEDCFQRAKGSCFFDVGECFVVLLTSNREIV